MPADAGEFARSAQLARCVNLYSHKESLEFVVCRSVVTVCCLVLLRSVVVLLLLVMVQRLFDVGTLRVGHHRRMILSCCRSLWSVGRPHWR